MSFKDLIGKKRAVISDASVLQPRGRRPFSEVRPYELTRPGYSEYDRLRIALGRHWYVPAGEEGDLFLSEVMGPELLAAYGLSDIPAGSYVFDAGLNVYIKDFMRDPIEMFKRAAAGGTIAIFGNVALYGAGGAAGTGITPGMAATSFEPILEDKHSSYVKANYACCGDGPGVSIELGFSQILPKEAKEVFDNVVALFAEGKEINNYDSNGLSVPTIIPPLIRRDKTYLDMPFEYSAPYSNIELNSLGSAPGTCAFADVTTEFSQDLMADIYIDKIRQLDIPESALPSIYTRNFAKWFYGNFYTAYSDTVNPSSITSNEIWDVNTIYKEHIFNALTINAYELQFAYAMNNAQLDDMEHYLNFTYPQTAQRNLNGEFAGSLDNIANNFRNVGLGVNAYNTLTPSEDDLRNWPMHAKLEMTVPPVGSIVEMFSDVGPFGETKRHYGFFAGLSQIVMAGTVLSPTDVGSLGYTTNENDEIVPITPGYLYSSLPFKFITTSIRDRPSAQALIDVAGGVSTANTSLRTWDIDNNFDALEKNVQDLELDLAWRPSATGVSNHDNHTLYITHDATDQFLEAANVEEALSISITKAMYKAAIGELYRKYRKIMGDKLLHSADMENPANGNLCHNELMMLRVEKQRFNEETGEYTTVQNIFLPNTDEGILKYFDTQVHYNQLYRYSVHAYFLVVGTEYGYNRVRINVLDGYGGELEYDSLTDSSIIGYDEQGNPIYSTDLVADGGECVDGEEPCPDDIEQGDPSSTTLSDLIEDMEAPTYRILGMQGSPGAWTTGFYYGKYDNFLPSLFNGIEYASPNLGPSGGYLITEVATDGSTLYRLREVELVGDYETVLIAETQTVTQAFPEKFFGKRIRAGTALQNTLPCVDKECKDNRVYVALPVGPCVSIIGAGFGATETIRLPDDTFTCISKVDPETFQMLSVVPEVEVPPEDPPADMKIQVKANVFHKPKVRLVEVPYFNTDGRQLSLVLDKPPLAPDVTFIPHPGDRNNVTFFFNRQAGIEELNPIIFGPEEQGRFAKHRIAQSVRDDEPITFMNDNPDQRFFVYRSTTPPTSITSLAEAGEAIGTVFNDYISPNVKYYYAFRSQDNRDNLSYPTKIFEVELVTLEDGTTSTRTAVLPLFKEYIPPKPKKQEPNTSFRRYLMIRPNDDNMAIEFQEEVDNESIMQAQPTFGGEVITPDGDEKEKFKLRLTSKGTGRKLDVNFSFTSKHILPPSDIPEGVNVTRNNSQLGADEDEWFAEERDRELDEEFSDY